MMCRRSYAAAAAILSMAATASAYSCSNIPSTGIGSDATNRRTTRMLLCSTSWLEKLWGVFSQEDAREVASTRILEVDQKSSFSGNAGTVSRTAGRNFNATSSRPSSRSYTTKKDARPFIVVTYPYGVQDDYNHYRTAALKSTPDRALSILTNDVMQRLQQEGTFAVQNGDLGENVLIDGVDFRFFQIGQQYQFAAAGQDDERFNTEGLTSSEVNFVTVEVTEPMTPCANLCKLPFINDDRLSPKARISRCKAFLDRLGQADGFRGWYCKIVQGGIIQVGDKLTKIENEASRSDQKTV